METFRMPAMEVLGSEIVIRQFRAVLFVQKTTVRTVQLVRLIELFKNKDGASSNRTTAAHLKYSK
jgi:hypothetical protein